MKTGNIILVGVVGLGAVGVYMYMKNKKAQESMLTGSLPTTNNQSGLLGGLTTGGSTTPTLSTTSDGVNPSDANVNLANATILATQRKELVAKSKRSCVGSTNPSSSGGGFLGGGSSSASLNTGCFASVKNAKTAIVELDKKLASLGYKVDSTDSLVRI